MSLTSYRAAPPYSSAPPRYTKTACRARALLAWWGMSEMVDRVADAIASAGDASAHYLAEVAVKAMREPTEAMMSAHLAYCEGRYEFGNSPTMIGCWQAMIDAALA
jgi:hypothetical protein